MINLTRSLIGGLLLALVVVTPARANEIYMPLVRAQPAPRSETEATKYALTLWVSAPWQQRPKMTVDPVLMQAAMDYAHELIKRAAANPDLLGDDPALAMGLDGSYANQRLRDAGYVLPDNYPDLANWVQQQGLTQVSIVWKMRDMAESPLSGEFMTGEGPIFGEQTHIGVAVAFMPHSSVRALVFISAPPQGK